MSGLWLCDTDDGIRDLYADLAPHAELLTPAQLVERLDSGQRPGGLLIDGATLRGLAPDLLRLTLELRRVAVCTGRASDVQELIGAAVEHARIIEKPFALDEFERMLDWLADPVSADADQRSSPARGFRLGA